MTILSSISSEETFGQARLDVRRFRWWGQGLELETSRFFAASLSEFKLPLADGSTWSTIKGGISKAPA